MVIREYRYEDERGWVHCRALSFLETSYIEISLVEIRGQD